MALKKVGRAVSVVLGRAMLFSMSRVIGLLRSLTHSSRIATANSFTFFIRSGLGFISLQTLNYYGYVKVDHGRIKKDFDDFLDLNNDGTVDKDDAELAYTKLLKILEFNLPAGGGFAAGFVGGLRSG